MKRERDSAQNSLHRTYEELRHHYDVERKIARRLWTPDREGRAKIYRTMYDELFAEVPNHPRLSIQNDPGRRRRTIQKKLALVRPFINDTSVALEFGPGDCQFSFELSKYVKRTYAADISNQIGDAVQPKNFELIVYDGFDLDLPDSSVDVIFSDQLIEHLHPDDTSLHFSLARRLLRPGGVYAFTTPHALTGPHDVSRHFSQVSEGFHLKEWTFEELVPLVRKAGFRSIAGYWFARGKVMRLPLWAFSGLERNARDFSISSRQKYLRYMLPSVTIAAYV